MGWKVKIEAALGKHGPLRTGDLIAALGYSLSATGLDVSTRFMDGLKAFRGSFCDSQAQRVLGNMVRRGEVIWQRAANLDNWYRLPDQKFPAEAAGRKRTLRQIMDEILALLPEDVVGDAELNEEWRRNVAAIEDDDIWVEFCPFVMSLHEDGWELADGDPICNWAGNTFTKVYPFDVDAAVVARRIKHGVGADAIREEKEEILEVRGK